MRHISKEIKNIFSQSYPKIKTKKKINVVTNFLHIFKLKGKEYVAEFKGAVSRNSAKLGNYKMPVELREM